MKYRNSDCSCLANSPPKSSGHTFLEAPQTCRINQLSQSKDSLGNTLGQHMKSDKWPENTELDFNSAKSSQGVKGEFSGAATQMIN